MTGIGYMCGDDGVVLAGRQTVSASEDNEEWNDFFNEETKA